MSGPDGGNDFARFVIIGNSAGGIGAVEAIRQVDKESEIVMISEEDITAYSRPLIAEFLANEKDERTILYRPTGFYDKKKVKALTGAKVAQVDLDARRIIFEDTERFSPLGYEKLLLTTGGYPFVPPMEGRDKKGIHTFINISDAKAIMDSIGKAEKVIVVGGGLIGICVTEALVKLGKKVVIVELMDRVLNMNLDAAGSLFMQSRLRSKGVDLVLNDSVVRFSGRPQDDDVVNGVELKSGRKIDCDMAIVAIGVRPRTELVLNTKVKINRGIVVDRRMETTVPNVFAAGDVAEAYDFVWGENRLSPIWPNAYLGGRTAGMNMAGVISEYPGSTALTSFTYFDLPIVSAGMHTPPKDQDGYDVISTKDVAKNTYKKFVLRDGIIKGMIMVGDIMGAGVVTDLMRDSVDVSSFKENLLKEEFGVSHLPKDMVPSRLRGDH